MNKNNILIGLIIISFLIELFCLFFITLPNEYNLKKEYEHSPLFLIINQPFFLPQRFDYYNGLYLVGGILGLCLFLVLFNFPSYTEIYIEIKKQLKYKYTEGKYLYKHFFKK